MAVFAALGVLTASAAASADDRPVILQGSTVVYARLIEPYRAAIERRAERRLEVVPNKSIHGLVALLEGRADIAMISSTIEAEVGVIHRRHPSLPVERLVSHEVARTRVAFARHPENPVSALTLDQIRRALLGEIASWRELGGADMPLAIVTVQPGGGVPSTVRSQLLDGRPFAARRLIEVEAPRHVLKVVEQEPGAIGITQLGLLRQRGLPEIATDSLVEQHLVLVSLGEPDARLGAVIAAVRWAAGVSAP
jgi:phosphate transport system substrate-binding protein